MEVYLPGRDVQIHDSPRAVSLDGVLGGFVVDLAPILGEATEA